MFLSMMDFLLIPGADSAQLEQGVAMLLFAAYFETPCRNLPEGVSHKPPGAKGWVSHIDSIRSGGIPIVLALSDVTLELCPGSVGDEALQENARKRPLYYALTEAECQRHDLVAFKLEACLSGRLAKDSSSEPNWRTLCQLSRQIPLRGWLAALKPKLAMCREKKREARCEEDSVGGSRARARARVMMLATEAARGWTKRVKPEVAKKEGVKNEVKSELIKSEVKTEKSIKQEKMDGAGMAPALANIDKSRRSRSRKKKKRSRSRKRRRKSSSSSRSLSKSPVQAALDGLPQARVVAVRGHFAQYLSPAGETFYKNVLTGEAAVQTSGDVDIRHETAARQIDRMLISQSKPKWMDQVFGWAQSTGQLWEPKRVSQTKVTIPTQKTQLQDQLDMLNESSSSSKGPEGPMLILKPENSFGSMNIKDQLNAMEKMMGNFQTGGLVGATSADKYSSDAAGAASRISKARDLQAGLWKQMLAVRRNRPI
ncbi:unnamed protein product [Symbiodinium microadriaticum]|nr:unnamed protein product [Symbiodinium microadriaticum]